MALHVINVSIDSRSLASLSERTTACHEDLSINKIESIGELLLEESFGIKDAVPENEDPDDESELTELAQDYDFFHPYVFTPLRAPVQDLITSNRPFRFEPILVHVPEIPAPPPQHTV